MNAKTKSLFGYIFPALGGLFVTYLYNVVAAAAMFPTGGAGKLSPQMREMSAQYLCKQPQQFCRCLAYPLSLWHRTRSARHFFSPPREQADYIRNRTKPFFFKDTEVSPDKRSQVTSGRHKK